MREIPEGWKVIEGDKGKQVGNSYPTDFEQEKNFIALKRLLVDPDCNAEAKSDLITSYSNIILRMLLKDDDIIKRYPTLYAEIFNELHYHREQELEK